MSLMLILLLDDNPDILALLSMMIQRALGPEMCQIISARSGVEGLALLEAGHAPDLIFANLHMPYMDGLGFVRELHGSARWAGIPLVIVTADQTPGVRQAARDSGADDFIAKPFDYAAVKNTLNRWQLSQRSHL